MALAAGWTEVILFCSFAAFLLVIKCCFINCCIVSKRYGQGGLFNPLDPQSTSSSTAELRSSLAEEALQNVQVNEPPPKFEDAIQNSMPISYIQIDDEPPPSYEQYFLSSQRQQQQHHHTFVPIHGS